MDIWEILTWVMVIIWILVPINYIVAKIIAKIKGIDDYCDL